MFERLKVRARLMLVGRRVRVLFFTCLFALSRLFCIAASTACGVALFLLIAQKPQQDWAGQDAQFVLICTLLMLLALIFLYFFAWFTRTRSLYFEALILAAPGLRRAQTPFGEELRGTLRTLLAQLTVTALKALWLLFFCSPAVALSIFLTYRLHAGGLATNVFNALTIANACLFVFGFAFDFCAVQRYLLAVRLVGQSDISVSEAIRESVRLLDGSSAAVAVFKLSLFVRALPSLWLFPAFYLIPYSRLAFELLCEKYRSGSVEVAKPDLNLFSTKRLPQV